MANKYNFSDEYGKDVSDKTPEWMNELFNNKIEKKETVIIKDIFNDGEKKIKKCRICGKPTETGICNSCKNLK